MIVVEALKPPIDYLDSTKGLSSDSSSIIVSTSYKPGSENWPYREFMVQVRSVDSPGW